MSGATGPEPRRASSFGRLPTVALLLDRIKDGYQWPLIRGAIEGAKDSGAHLLCFAGGVVGAPHGEGGERNGVFDLVRTSSVDAVVVATGAIGNRMEPPELETYCERFRPLPMCCIGAELANMSSVCIDNASGMRSVIEHLFHAHGMKRVAFVRGPVTNVDARARFSAYLEVLTTEGIAVAPELIVTGDFDEGSGCEAVRVLLDERKLSHYTIDAIVAANDAMAFGVIAELTRRGVRVPDQIAVVGFDDVDEASLTLAALTTVRQPLFEQGRDAVRLVLRQLRLGAPPERTVRRTVPVIRRSCRCLGHHNDVDLSGAGEGGVALGFEASFMAKRQRILAAVTRAARGEFSAAGADWGERMLNAFAEQSRTKKADTFLKVYDDQLRRLSATGAELALSNDVISALRASVLPCFDTDPHGRARAEAVFHDIRVMTADAMRRAEAWRRIHAETRAAALGRAAAAITSARDLDELARAVATHLPGLGVARCFLAEYGDGGVGAARNARLVIDQRPEARSADLKDHAPRPIAEILRRVLPTTGEHAFAVLPIASDGRDAGILVVELGAPAGYLYEVLREVFQAALQVATRAAPRPSSQPTEPPPRL